MARTYCKFVGSGQCVQGVIIQVKVSESKNQNCVVLVIYIE